MNHTNEFISCCLAAHAPCLAMRGTCGPYAIQGVSISESEALFEWDDDSDWWLIESDCKLILKPISAISDEDAIEVAKIMFVSQDEKEEIAYRVIRGPEAIVVNINDGNIELAIYGHGFAANSEVVDGYIPTIPSAYAIDFLRSKGYDCGFRHITSLIEAGIAIKEPNDERSVATDVKSE